MHLFSHNKISGWLLVCLFLIGFAIKGYSNAQETSGYPWTPAIIQISSEEQHDSVGFNIAKELPGILYDRIMDETINLYKSPLKETRISPSELQQIEKNSKTRFADSKNLFVDEDWQMLRKDFEFKIRGFFCINRSEEGQQTSYGYVGISEVEALLKSLVIKTNANGPKNLTYWDALHSKRYAFRLVMFGSEDLKRNPETSSKLVNEAFFSDKVSTSALKLPKRKEVEYVINRVNVGENTNNSVLFEAIEDYFKLNPHEFFNLGGKEFSSHLNPKPQIKITKIDVIETWSKENGKLVYKTDKVILYANNHPLKALTTDELQSMGFLVKFQPITQFIESKEFYFTIIRIDDQSIYSHQAQIALNQLLTGKWDHVLIKN